MNLPFLHHATKDMKDQSDEYRLILNSFCRWRCSSAAKRLLCLQAPALYLAKSNYTITSESKNIVDLKMG